MPAISHILVPSNECNFSITTRNERTSHFCKALFGKVVISVKIVITSYSYCQMPMSKDIIYTCVLLDLFRNVMNYHILRECRLQISHCLDFFLLFLSLKTTKNSSGQIWQPINPCDGWRQDEHGIHKHTQGLWILCSVSHLHCKKMHSLFFIIS